MSAVTYLFELDSYSTTSNTEGFYALFHEIVHKGNCVAVSMNQLTDSSFFAEAIKDEITYSFLLRLFEIGALRVSRYGEFRTPSQYVQAKVADCITAGKDSFIFSNMPIQGDDPDSLAVIGDALKYCDVKRIREELAHRQDLDLESICRFVNIILELSSMNSEALPLKVPAGRSFMEFLDLLLSLLRKRSLGDSQLDEEVQEAIVSLEDKREKITANPNARSTWLNAYKGEESRYPFAIKIINYCYNYTIQDSISGVCKSYEEENLEESLWADLRKRIENERRISNHRYKQKIRDQLWRWKMLIRFAQYRKKQAVVPGGATSKTPFRNQLLWKARSFGRIISSFGWAVLYSAIFFLTELFMNLLENIYDHYAAEQFAVFAEMILSIFLFGLIGSIISICYRKITKGKDMPDIIECIKDILERLLDCGYLFFGGLYDKIRMLR